MTEVKTRTNKQTKTFFVGEGPQGSLVVLGYKGIRRLAGEEEMDFTA